jgi:hypothetical protein
MTYYWTSSTDAGPLTETLYDTCTLLGTTAANCHAIVTVTVAGESISSASPSIDTESASLGYAQIPITAGLAAALRSVSSCSANSGVVTSSPVDTTASVYSRVHSRMSATGKASPVTYAGAGLSTGTKVGIGVGVGIGGAALPVMGGVLLYRMRTRRKPSPPHQPSMVMAPHLSHPQIQSNRHGPYEFEQPATRHEMPVG